MWVMSRFWGRYLQKAAEMMLTSRISGRHLHQVPLAQLETIPDAYRAGNGAEGEGGRTGGENEVTSCVEAD